MKPQLTLQTPLELPYQEISNYLNKLWISEDKDNSGANTFTLMVWQPAWLEQCLVQKGLVNGPITGNLSPEIIEVAKKFILDQGLPITTSLNSEEVLNSLKKNLSNKDFEDFRGQFFESSISTLNPRRLITLAPTLNKNSDIKTFVSAYCPLSDTPAMQPICGDLVVIRGDSDSIFNKGLKIIDGLSIGAKTGTAQLSADNDATHAWIIGFAGYPDEPPAVAFAVFVEANSGAGEQTGGRIAAPIARDVLLEIFD